ncbi:MAG: cupin domain-containing protein [Polyangiales bacterium]
MSQPVSEEIAEYVLGTLSEARRREIDALVERSAALKQEVRTAREALGLLSDAVMPVAASTRGRAALLSALDGAGRFAPFVSDLTRHLDLTKARVRELLAFIDDATRWEPGPIPGIMLMHFAAGPNAIAPDTGFVRFPKGLRFPRHRHVGHEVNYVLQGAVRDDDGTLYLPGEAIIMAPGSVHEFSIPEDADALVVVVQAGFEII